MEILRNTINKYNKEVWKPDEIKKKRIKTDSWFDINYGWNNRKQNKKDYNFNVQKLEDHNYMCKKVIILPSERQRKILLKWMDTYIRMYNETIKVIKRQFYEKKKVNLNFQRLRTDHMLEQKEKLYKSSGLQNDDSTRINKHILDGAIKDVCTSYSSAFKNFKRKIIKHFRMRYIKQSKPQKILKIEKLLFSKDRKTFCGSVLGSKINTSENIDFSDVNSDCTLLYNSFNKRFTLLIPIETVKEDGKEKPKYEAIGVDPGIRTFMTGYSKGHTLDIGNNLQQTITKELKEIDSINESELSKKKRRLAENKRYNKINNLVDDLQWKTINHLTNNYHIILIGNMSTKGIVGNWKSKGLYKTTKRIALLMRLYVFTERLKYKCSIKGCDYGMINERYTSKMCTFCGNVKEDLGSNKIYNCNKCNNSIGRDINGARNIYLLGLK